MVAGNELSLCRIVGNYLMAIIRATYQRFSLLITLKKKHESTMSRMRY